MATTGGEELETSIVHTMKLALPLAPMLVLGLIACGGSDTGAGASVNLEESSWVLSSTTVDGDVVPASAVGEATLTFGADGRASGSTGCNRFTATWSQDGDSLAIQVGAVTQAACLSPELALQEQAILALLPQTSLAEVLEGELRLKDSAGSTLLDYIAGLDGLANTSWSATGVNNQTGGVESTALTSSVTAVFAADGTMSGSTGCRDYTAFWDADADSIVITDVVPAGQTCSGEQATLEASYVAALESAATFILEGSALNLRDSDGATQVNYSLASA